VRVAALYDIHGNIGALDAVLADVSHERVDVLVVGGDVAWGPFPGETVDRLMELGGAARFVRGNTDREIVAAFDAGERFDPALDDPDEELAAWAAERLTRRQRDFLASFEPTVALEVAELGRTLFCHATPTSDEEIFTGLTPDAEVEALLGDVEASVVVCGHTHVQSDRRIGATRVVKAGSVGAPNAEEPGAYWTLLGPDVSFRHTRYDLAGVAAAVRASGFPRPGFAEENILTVPPPDEAERRLEQVRLERRRS
jgi:predicted phosphodiesterase